MEIAVKQYEMVCVEVGEHFTVKRGHPPRSYSGCSCIVMGPKRYSGLGF